MKELEKLRKEFQQQGYASKTIQVYENHIRRFHDCVSPPYTNEKIQEYVDGLTGITSNYQNQVVSAIRSYFMYVHQQDVHIKRKKVQIEAPKVLSRKEIDKLLSLTSNQRLKCILLLAYGSGMKVNEIVGLRRVDIKWRSNIIDVGDRQTVLTKETKKNLKLYLRRAKESTWLFVGQNVQKHLSVRAVQRDFTMFIKQGKFPKDYSINQLRQSFAQHMLEGGIPLESVAYLMGHKSVKSTERYQVNKKLSISDITRLINC